MNVESGKTKDVQTNLGTDLENKRLELLIQKGTGKNRESFL